MCKRLFLLFVSLLFVANGFAGVQTLTWQKLPLPIPLIPNVERVVELPGAATVRYDSSKLPKNALQVENNGGALYITAHAPIPKTRLFVTVNNSHTVLLLDVKTVEEGSNVPISIRLPGNSTSQNGTRETLSTVSLMRFAIQQLYAPNRLMEKSGNLYSVPLNLLSTVPLFTSQQVLAMPLHSWSDGTHFVSAIQVRNLRPYTIHLDYRAVCGHYQGIVFYPNRILTRYHSKQDSTVVFLVSHESLKQALANCGGSM